MNLQEFKEKVSGVKLQLVSETDKCFGDKRFDWQFNASKVLKELSDARAEKFIAKYGLVDTVILIEEIAELIQAITGVDQWAIVEEIADTQLCLISQAQFHGITIFDYDRISPHGKKQLEQICAVDMASFDGLLKTIKVLAGAQQTFCKSIRDKVSEDDILMAYFIIDICCTIISKNLNLFNIDENTILAAGIVKLERITNRVKKSDIK